jgi:tRNA (guanosine-2'-O-)-methyltransferase
MYRGNNDFFSPTPARRTSRDTQFESWVPSPGPHPDWTAQGVIERLEPLTLPKRRARLRTILPHRLTSVTVLFDNAHDPYNGSAVLRSCDAFGIQRVHVLSENKEFTASKIIAKGSERWVDVIEHTDPQVAITLLKNSGYKLLASHPQGNLTPADLAGEERIALLLGNEIEGLGRFLTEAADDTVRIPMCGFVESLNVSVSAAILLQAATSGRQGDLSPEEQEITYARWLRHSVPRADEVLNSFSPS